MAIFRGRADSADSLVGGAGNDTLRGGDGLDTVSWRDVSSGMSINLSGSPLSVDLQVNISRQNNDSAEGVVSTRQETDTISGFEGYLLGNGNDFFNSSSLDNFTVSGGAGRDFIYTTFGADSILGEDGDDVIDTGDEADTILGGSGDDFLFGGRGNDVIRGEAGRDVLTGGSGDDTLDGGDGDDLLFADLADSDLMSGGAGKDKFGLSPFVFDQKRPTVNDFSVVDDVLSFSLSVVNQRLSNGSLTAGTLAAANFVAGSGVVAVDSNDYFIYDTSNGALYFDPDGSGSAASEHIAIILMGNAAPSGFSHQQIVLAGEFAN